MLPCDDPEWSNFTKFFAQNFESLGLKKLISTSFATESKNKNSGGYQFTLDDFLTDFERKSKNYDAEKSLKKGKIFTLTRRNKKVDINDLNWSYLEGDGDFRSEEVCKLRDEADFIITNPPFSMYKEFLSWIIEADKKFLIIANQNAITYKETFYQIIQNKLWLGPSIHSGDREFRVPDSYPLNAAGHRIDSLGNKFIRVKGVRWFTNIEHGRRHRPLSLMTMEDNIKYSKHKEIMGKKYVKYENFDAIDIPFYDAIPKDYDGVMGVPNSFMDFYCPEQFEIIGYERDDDLICSGIDNVPTEFLELYRKQGGKGHITHGMHMLCVINSDGDAKVPFSRILVKYTDEWIASHQEDFNDRK